MITIPTNITIYSYNPKDLWLTYGISCAAALLSTILGIHSIWRNGGVGYQSTFSTYVRATRNLEIRDMIDPNDRGTEPLPKKLADASIIIDTCEQSAREISMPSWRR